MLKLLGFSFLCGLLGASAALYLGFGTLSIMASYLAGSMAGTLVSVSIAVVLQEDQAPERNADTSKIPELRPAA